MKELHNNSFLPENSRFNNYQDYYIQENPAAISAGAAVFNILTSTITNTTKGDLVVSWPSSSVGVTATGLPSSLTRRLRSNNTKRTIFRYRKTNPISGIEQVNIKLTCEVQYNGPSVQATFGFAAGGTRSRLMRDTKISIRNPLSLERLPTSSSWKNSGLHVYPVVKIPIEVTVDHPWPQSNDHWTFDLIISGMYGFGRRRGGSYIRNMRHVKN